LTQLPGEAKTILLNTEQLELYSLEPLEQAAKGEPTLHGWKILGKTTLTGESQIQGILEALNKGLEDSDKAGVKCFDPRHAMRGSWQGKTVELLICFECCWVYVYLDENENETAQVEISRAPEGNFNRFLIDAGLPLAKKRGRKK
jgi:hypothetical protein